MAGNEPVATSYALEIYRFFNAPRSLVFRVWTSPEHLARWWGPKDFSAPSLSMDFRPGGKYRHAIRSAEGAEYWMRGVYREIVEPERIVFTFAWEEDASQPTNETLVTVTFEDHGGKTRLTFRQEPFDSVQQRDSHAEGWGECLDRLLAHLARDQ
ncbi:SRPBCC domain-containing protein [Mesorhizobium sp. 1B3]|uniref:SRPBCC domain-containing protein n=1 Tax=Mesorhizobium sp. 1B3 TaxID=3243599 RepID=UPI003D977ECA